MWNIYFFQKKISLHFYWKFLFKSDANLVPKRSEVFHGSKNTFRVFCLIFVDGLRLFIHRKRSVSRFFAHVPLSMVEPFWFFYYLLSESGCVLFFQNWLHCLKRRHLRVNRLWKKSFAPQKPLWIGKRARPFGLFVAVVEDEYQTTLESKFFIKSKSQTHVFETDFYHRKRHRIICAKKFKGIRNGNIWKTVIKGS